tara:strand:- start:815 stop:1045 length:231 start_codon:yes stop_codon:yes gene_type:complete
MEVERLDICNIIEVDKIRKLLIRHPDLLSMFEILIIIVNNRLNSEQPRLSRRPNLDAFEENLKYLSVDSESSDDDK